MAGHGTKTGRGRAASLCAAILGVAALASASASSAGPASEETAQLISSTTAAETPVGVPDGIHTVHVVLVGGSGQTVTSPGTVAGGRGARVEADLSVTPNTTLFVNVGGNGANGDGGFNGGADGGSTQFSFFGGGGGGATDVRTVTRNASPATTLASRLIVAGGGGGAGTNGGSCNGSASSTGGAGGNAGSAGSTAGGDLTSGRGGGGGAGTGGAGGSAGAAGTGGTIAGATPGIVGSLGSGGKGGAGPDNEPAGEAGGGGGGLYGGGGGGGGNSGGNCPVEGGGGGGGGSSLVPAGGSSTVPNPALPPSATITATYPLTEITKAPGKVKTRRRKALVRIKFESSSGATEFECSIDDKPYEACTSPLEQKFKLGKHVVLVRAINGIDNADQTPAQAKFRVVKK